MILPPPAIYDFPYPGPQTVEVLPAPEVDRLCRQSGVSRPFQIIGCQFFIGDHCFNLISKHAEAVLRLHENAHCNGWRH